MVEINVPTGKLGIGEKDPQDVVELREELQVVALKLKGDGEPKLSCISWSEPENILKSD